jgi:hypothetical protein
MDLTHYSVGAVPQDACKNHEHKVDKYRIFFRFLHFFLLIIVNKSVTRKELDVLTCILAGEKASFSI